MGAIFFYIFIYFLGYYGSNIFNMFTVRPLITNRFTAALIPVFCVAMLHGYMIVTRPPPASQNVTVESALFTYVAMPVVIVTLGAFYFMWNSRRAEEEEVEDAEDDDREDLETGKKTAETSTDAEKPGIKTTSSGSAKTESAEDKTKDDSEENGAAEKKNKDA